MWDLWQRCVSLSKSKSKRSLNTVQWTATNLLWNRNLSFSSPRFLQTEHTEDASLLAQWWVSKDGQIYCFLLANLISHFNTLLKPLLSHTIRQVKSRTFVRSVEKRSHSRAIFVPITRPTRTTSCKWTAIKQLKISFWKAKRRQAATRVW